MQNSELRTVSNFNRLFDFRFISLSLVTDITILFFIDHIFQSPFYVFIKTILRNLSQKFRDRDFLLISILIQLSRLKPTSFIPTTIHILTSFSLKLLNVKESMTGTIALFLRLLPLVVDVVDDVQNYCES